MNLIEAVECGLLFFYTPQAARQKRQTSCLRGYPFLEAALLSTLRYEECLWAATSSPDTYGPLKIGSKRWHTF